MTGDPMLDGITRYDDGDYEIELDPMPHGIYVLFSDLPALIARVREDERERIRTGVTGIWNGYAPLRILAVIDGGEP